MKAKKMRICFAIITVLFMLFTVSPLSLPMPVEALGEGGDTSSCCLYQW